MSENEIETVEVNLIYLGKFSIVGHPYFHACSSYISEVHAYKNMLDYYSSVYGVYSLFILKLTYIIFNESIIEQRLNRIVFYYI